MLRFSSKVTANRNVFLKSYLSEYWVAYIGNSCCSSSKVNRLDLKNLRDNDKDFIENQRYQNLKMFAAVLNQSK